jgi:hypothetical protein
MDPKSKHPATQGVTHEVVGTWAQAYAPGAVLDFPPYILNAPDTTVTRLSNGIRVATEVRRAGGGAGGRRQGVWVVHDAHLGGKRARAFVYVTRMTWT